ncbi:unnamed protein product [Amoebophrya sp. A120]|nr:unnamed protein product [Amoebophrya sp. A120]|eukprot:GSA120T00006594001.1
MAKFLPVIGEAVTAIESAAKLVASGVVLPFDEEAAEKLLEGSGQAWVEYSEQNVIACGLNILITAALEDDDEGEATTGVVPAEPQARLHREDVELRSRATNASDTETDSTSASSADGNEDEPRRDPNQPPRGVPTSDLALLSSDQVSVLSSSSGQPTGRRSSRVEELRLSLQNAALTFVSSVPLVGHIKGIVHFVEGDDELGTQCMHSATRPILVIGAAAATAVTCGGALLPAAGAAVMGGVVNDGVFSAVDSAVQNEKKMHGLFHQVIDRAILEEDPNAIVDVGLLLATDAVTGAATAAVVSRVVNNGAAAAQSGGGNGTSGAATKSTSAAVNGAPTSSAATTTGATTPASGGAAEGAASGTTAGSAAADATAATAGGAAGRALAAEAAQKAGTAAAAGSSSGSAATNAAVGISRVAKATLAGTVGGTRIVAGGLAACADRRRREPRFGADLSSDDENHIGLAGAAEGRLARSQIIALRHTRPSEEDLAEPDADVGPEGAGIAVAMLEDIKLDSDLEATTEPDPASDMFDSEPEDERDGGASDACPEPEKIHLVDWIGGC